ncbi:MAG: nuclear transport factor 2 family protein, partial [Chloroflexi bacterium]|nr:nuclear transport factor 2 family protein [Chloroflexota bacterium]
MSNGLNQQNKEIVWDYWQKLNHIGVDNAPAAIRAAVHDDVDWNGSAPIDQIQGVDNLISGFWLPLLHSFPDLKIRPYVFMGGIDSGMSDWDGGDTQPSAGDVGSEWVSGCGYLSGSFVKDWLGIPATGNKTNIWFGQFYVMREGKIAECYVQYDILSVMRQAGYQVLPPSPGFDGGKIPGPVAKDGILLTEQDALESRKSLQLVEAMGKGLMRYVRDRDGGDMSRMEQDKYWHQD